METRNALNSMFSPDFIKEMEEKKKQAQKQEESKEEEKSLQKKLTKTEYVPFQTGKEFVNRIVV